MKWRAWSVTVLLVQALAVLCVAAVAGFRYQLPLIGYWKAALGVAIIGTGAYAIAVLARCFLRRERDPSRTVLTAVMECDLPLVAFLVGTQLALLGWLKVMLPYAVGFWADPYLADADAFLFGTDPWMPLHRLGLGHAFDQIYISWAPVSLSTVLILAFAPKDARKGRCLLAYFLTLTLCAILQYSLPSAGPVFFSAIGLGERFAEMPILPWVRVTADYLWQTYTSPGFRIGSGISAWPSFHVAGAFWIALVVRVYFPRLQLIGWAYWAAIMVGSVYLGWHYALDGIAGSALAYIAYLVAPRLINRSIVPVAKVVQV